MVCTSCCLGKLLLIAVDRNESFTFHAAPATQPKMHAWIYDHKTLGKDKLLGSAEIDVRHVHICLAAWC